MSLKTALALSLAVAAFLWPALLLWLFPYPGPAFVLLGPLISLIGVVVAVTFGILARWAPSRGAVLALCLAFGAAYALLTLRVFAASDEDVAGTVQEATEVWTHYGEVGYAHLGDPRRMWHAAALAKYRRQLPNEAVRVVVSGGRAVVPAPCVPPAQSLPMRISFLVERRGDEVRSTSERFTYGPGGLRGAYGECEVALGEEDLFFCPERGVGTTSKVLRGKRGLGVSISCVRLRPEGGFALLFAHALGLRRADA